MKNKNVCKRLISIFLLTNFFLSCSLFLKAETDKYLKHHVILAIDKAGCDGWIGNKEVGLKVRNILLDFRQDDFLIYRPLFQIEDYLSILGFAVDAYQQDMSMYATP